MDLDDHSRPSDRAVIGYFTNYLAVKMLFRPRREIKIGSKTLPFTPGVIPKGKPRLARVIGRSGRRTPWSQARISERACCRTLCRRLWQIRRNPILQKQTADSSLPSDRWDDQGVRDDKRKSVR